MLIRTLDCSTPPTRKLLEAAAAFGLGVRHNPDPCAGRPTFDAAAMDLHRRAGPGTISLVTGPSGAGKSTALERLELVAQRDGHAVLRMGQREQSDLGDVPLIELIELPLNAALRSLACAGLADAMLLSRCARQLSEGERFRARLAVLLARVGTHDRPTTLVVDEFASVLDRTTARCLCGALRRWLAHARRSTPRLRLVLATAHDDVAAWFHPNYTMTCVARVGAVITGACP